MGASFPRQPSGAGKLAPGKKVAELRLFVLIAREISMHDPRGAEERFTRAGADGLKVVDLDGRG